LFGAQAIIVGVDVVKSNLGYFCSYKSNTLMSNISFREHLKAIQEYEFGELLITSVDKDGTRSGYDVDLYSEVSAIISAKIPLIVSGGAGNLDDFTKIMDLINPSGLAAGSIYMFTEITPLGVKKYLRALGFKTRS
jgi:cyclase